MRRTRFNILGVRAPKKMSRPPVIGKPRNEVAYRGCKRSLNAFFKSPSKEAYRAFQEALQKLAGVNPTAAWSLRKLFNDRMFERALKEENLK